MKKKEETKKKELVPLKKEKSLVSQPPSLDEILSSIQIYIPPAAPTGPGGAWELHFFLDAVKFFKVQNLPPDHIRMALINLVVLTSAHVGNPIVLEVIDDFSAGAADLVQQCMDLTSDLFWKKFDEMSLDELVKAKEHIGRKCIVGLDSKKFEKGKEILKQFLAQQKWVDQRTVETKIGNRSLTTPIVGPTACVLISKDPEKLILTHPSFLGIQFKPGIQGFYVPEMEERERAQLETYGDEIRASLHRLKERSVKISYWQDVVQHLQSHPFVLAKGEMLRRMLKVITIINNPPTLTRSEFHSRLYNSDPRKVELAKGLPGISQGVLDARKADYYILWMLMFGMLRNEGVSFSERERRVFRVVKNFNESALGSVLGPLNATKFQKLAQIPRSPSTWPDILEIFELVNKDGGEEIGSTPTVYNVLQGLEEKGAIKDAKDPNGRQHGFYITTWELPETISLPDPSMIEDPFTGKEPIEVINPITGAVEVV